jgi:hypothetical protein
MTEDLKLRPEITKAAYMEILKAHNYDMSSALSDVQSL